MNPEEYGANYKEHLLKQYELYVQMADKISERRDKANVFYTTLLTGLFAVVSIVGSIENHDSLLSTIGILLVSMVGILLCIIWYFNIESYRQLNSGKFKIIHKMEKNLPFRCYDEEWEVLGRGQDSKKYRRLTRVEHFVPLVLAVPYLGLALCFLFRLCAFLVQYSRR